MTDSVADIPGNLIEEYSLRLVATVINFGNVGSGCIGTCLDKNGKIYD